uniref:Nucleotide-diphospho-sugar transferase domain-containing protein n=3 Tax=Wuchereria bancrofti TaxID=6293 RepID=A0A1I8ECS7_WUCBA
MQTIWTAIAIYTIMIVFIYFIFLRIKQKKRKRTDNIERRREGKIKENWQLKSVLMIIKDYVERSQVREIKLAVLTILKDFTNINEYQLAMETFECYCIYQRYEWVIINVSQNDTLKLLCPHNEFFFQRHCVTAQFLQENNNFDYVLFIDSDMGVINPKKRIEEYIMDDKDIIFYNRIWNFEVMAGSYLAKNTKFVINFLRMWANYNYRLPHSFHGSDNAAIHKNNASEKKTKKKENVKEFSASSFVTHCINKRETLRTIMEYIKLKVINIGFVTDKFCRNYNDLFIYEACVRAQLETNEKWKRKISVLPKGKSWARDGWLTDSKWSEQDFIFHGWQKRRLNAPWKFASWKLPFLSTKFNMSICGTHNYIENWKYNKSFVRESNEIRIQLNRIIILKDNEYYRKKKKAESLLTNFMKNKLIWHNSSINSSSSLAMPLNIQKQNLNSNFSII